MFWKRLYVTSSFSLDTLERTTTKLTIFKLDDDAARRTLESEIKEEPGFISAVEDESTANLITQLLGIEVPANKREVKLVPGDIVLVFQPSREGTENPHMWFKVYVDDLDE